MHTTFFRAAGLSTVALTAALVLGACSSSDDSAAPDAGQNTDACTQFETTYDEFTALTKAGPADSDVDTWNAAKTAAMSEFATLGDTATGAVQEGLTTLNAALPADSLELAEPNSESGQAFVDNSTAVASACEADGTTITLDEFPLTKFTN